MCNRQPSSTISRPVARAHFSIASRFHTRPPDTAALPMASPSLVLQLSRSRFTSHGLLAIRQLQGPRHRPPGDDEFFAFTHDTDGLFSVHGDLVSVDEVSEPTLWANLINRPRYKQGVERGDQRGIPIREMLIAVG